MRVRLLLMWMSTLTVGVTADLNQNNVKINPMSFSSRTQFWDPSSHLCILPELRHNCRDFSKNMNPVRFQRHQTPDIANDLEPQDNFLDNLERRMRSSVSDDSNLQQHVTTPLYRSLETPWMPMFENIISPNHKQAENINYHKYDLKSRGTRTKFSSSYEDQTLENITAGYETDEYCIYDLRLSYIFGSPDGVLKRMIAFNGQFPGPILRCTMGKTMVVRVTNGIEDSHEPTSVHWHGIHQNLSPFYDGPQSTTQCPVVRETSMIYKFKLFQAGTYWYHSHHSYQYVDGAWGFLIIKNKGAECWQNSYDDERLITINDWIHYPAKYISQLYLTQGNLPAANSSLINGRGIFNCSNAQPGQICNPNLQGPAVIDVTQGKRYRLRILNSSGLETYNFSIDAHKFVVIETDGVDTFKSPKADILPILPAQRYSLIVIMDQPLGEYWIRISGSPGEGPGLIGRAILRYEPNPDYIIQAPSEPTAPASDVDQGRPYFSDMPWADIMLSGGIQVPEMRNFLDYFPNKPPEFDEAAQQHRDSEHALMVRNLWRLETSPVDPSTAILLDQQQCPPLALNGADGSAPNYFDRLFVIDVTDCPIPGSPSRMCMNGEPFVPGEINSPPVLYQVIKGIQVHSASRPFYTPNLQEVIRIVINNYHFIPHPWHLHGHSFWVLGAGEANAGEFNFVRDAAKLTTQGVRRDTTFTLEYSWAVITYITDNPGAWLFHCHINWHLQAGTAMTLIEGEIISRQIYKYPPLDSIKTCARVGVEFY